MLPWLPLLWACQAQGPDAPPEPGSWFEVRIGERVVGATWSAERRVDGVREVWRGQRFRWLLQGSESVVGVRVRARLDGEGQVVQLDRWRNEDPVQHWEGEPVWWLDQVASDGLLRAGRFDALHVGTLTVEPVVVHADGEGWSWTLAGVQTAVGPDGQRWGVFREVPVASEPTLQPVDPVALLRRPGARIEGARGARRAVWEIDGEQRVVESPIPLEVPSETLRTIERLVRVVQRRLDHVATPGTPDAMAALQTGRGDCNEFAAVFIALAAEQGLTARPVAGLVYTDGGAMGPGLDLHAWAEVDLGPEIGWVAVDPALGQPLADAAHLSLAVGEQVASAAVVVASGAAIALVAVR